MSFTRSHPRRKGLWVRVCMPSQGFFPGPKAAAVFSANAKGHPPPPRSTGEAFPSRILQRDPPLPGRRHKGPILRPFGATTCVPTPGGTDLVPRWRVQAAEEGGWQCLEASLWEAVSLLSRAQPSPLVLRSRSRRRARGGAGCSRGCLSPPGRPRRWAGAEHPESLRRRLPPLPHGPAARLPQCLWGVVGGRWAPGRGGGGGCGAGQKRPPIPAAGEPRAPGAPASPPRSHGHLCERQRSPRLLQPHRRSHDDRELPPPGKRSGGRTAGCGGAGAAGAALPEPGGSPGVDCGGRGVGPAGLGGLQGKATHPRAPTGYLGGVARLGWDEGMKANCFSCNRASLEEALEVAAGLPAHFRAFPLLAPLLLHLPPFPSHRPLLSPSGVGPRLRCGALGAGGGRRFVAAAVSCRDATAVGDWYRCAPDTGDRSARCTEHSPAGRKPPLPRLCSGLGWVPVSKRQEHRTLRPTLRRPQSAGSQPARELALESGVRGERERIA